MEIREVIHSFKAEQNLLHTHPLNERSQETFTNNQNHTRTLLTTVRIDLQMMIEGRGIPSRNLNVEVPGVSI
jgi:hypothetical protein